tara:strand:+ start:6085 stop:6222 length:138 start_codon:yes stop_codon:yes gene_type:complete
LAISAPVELARARGPIEFVLDDARPLPARASALPTVVDARMVGEE